MEKAFVEEAVSKVYTNNNTYSDCVLHIEYKIHCHLNAKQYHHY